MRHIFNFPDIGEGLEEGTINEWLVKKGQEVEVGDPLVNMETDKVAADIPSPKTGTIVQLFGKVGETITVGSPLVEIEVEGESGGDDSTQSDETETKEKPEKESSEKEETKTEPVEENAGVVGSLEVASGNAFMPASDEGSDEEDKPAKKRKKALATPVARAYAKDLNIDINTVQGTGPAGRVTKKDILEYSNKVGSKQSQSASEPQKENLVEYEELTQVRKTIAKNMSRSKNTAAHMTVFDEVEISELVKLRAKYKERFAEQDVKLSYMPFILKSIAVALKKHKSLNAQLDLENNRIAYKNYFNIGIAVDTEYGLVVPVIKNVDKLSIKEIANKVNELAEKARKRELSLEEMKDGTFTITNYGAIGGQYAVPVINYPESAILGIGRIVEKPTVQNGEITVGKMLPLSLSVDHRIVDGGETARFLNRVMEYIGDPASLIME